MKSNVIAGSMVTGLPDRPKAPPSHKANDEGGRAENLDDEDYFYHEPTGSSAARVKVRKDRMAAKKG
jgi:hypothetical protein